MMGFLNIMSSEVMMEFSTSATSPVMRDMMSPLRCSLKNPTLRLMTLSNSSLRILCSVRVRMFSTVHAPR